MGDCTLQTVTCWRLLVSDLFVIRLEEVISDSETSRLSEMDKRMEKDVLRADMSTFKGDVDGNRENLRCVIWSHLISALHVGLSQMVNILSLCTILLIVYFIHNPLNWQFCIVWYRSDIVLTNIKILPFQRLNLSSLHVLSWAVSSLWGCSLSHYVV